MAITADSLTELVLETRRAYAEVNAELEAAQERVLDLIQQRENVASEEEAFVASLCRRFPDHKIPGDEPIKKPTDPIQLDGGMSIIPKDNWSYDSRSDAVQRAVAELTEAKGFATPAEIEQLLKTRARDDSRDAIGAALAYLNRTNKVYSRARAEWVIGERP